MSMLRKKAVLGKVVVLLSLTLGLVGCEISPETGTRQKVDAKERGTVEVKKIKILLANSRQIMWQSQVQNKTKDRTVTSLNWKIEIYDPLRQLKVDELHITQSDATITDKQISIPPGAEDFFTSRLLDLEGGRWIWRDDYKLKISIENYTSSGR